MHQYNIGAPTKRTAINSAGPFLDRKRGNQCLPIAMDYFTKWLEVYAIPNYDSSKVANTLVTNFFCHFRVLWQLHRVQNFEYWLKQEVLEHLEICKTHTTPPHCLIAWWNNVRRQLRNI
jgi:hypothetical protein